MHQGQGRRAAGKGGIFAATADASGKLMVEAIKWDGPDTMKQCIVAAGAKATVYALPGPCVGSLWEFLPPGEQSSGPPKTPDDFKIDMQPLAETMQNQVIECGRSYARRRLRRDHRRRLLLYNNGQAYAPTVIPSDAKDGSFDSCVQEWWRRRSYPVVEIDKPFGATGALQDRRVRRYPA